MSSDRDASAPSSASGGFVYLVGAGPGDPGLLTVRAVELLALADVVAHDELISPAILSLVGRGAEVLSVGRRHGQGTVGYRLHPVVLERARAGKRVVRLKAGDPLVFGRGGEEAEELREAGIPFAIVPGVSAALGAAAAAGIPLTHRSLASDVAFLTGHDVDGHFASQSDWSRVAAGRGTVVLYMAARKLAQNLARLVAAGRAPETRAALVAAATTPAQVVVVGTLADLADKAAHVDPSLPAVVFVGEVVALARRLAPPAPGPLAGCRLLVGRARPGPSPLAEALRRLGAEVLEAPRISVEPALDRDELTAALARLDREEEGARALVFACEAGVEIALGAARAVTARLGLPIFAIGEAAGAALERAGVAPALRVDDACDEALRAQAPRFVGARLLVVTSEDGRPHLIASLEQLGARVEAVKAYRVVRALPRLEACALDALVLPSSSAANAIFGSDAGPRLVDVPVAAIGKLTAAAATQGGARRVVLAETDTVEALVACAVALVNPADQGALRANDSPVSPPAPIGDALTSPPMPSASAAPPPPRPDDAPPPASLVLVYTGHGKGKTTAALGLAFRALGRGMRVAVVQFIKGKWKTGERLFAETIPGLTFLVMGQGFTWESDDLSRDKRAAEAAWTKSKELIAAGAHPVVILDEITYAIHYGFIPLADVIAALTARPAGVSVVLTGRNAPEELTAVADVVTEMSATKHPFTKGHKALLGIDF